MGLFSDLSKQVDDFLSEEWTVEDARIIPEPENLRLSNHAKTLDAVVLYADLADSTPLVDKNPPEVVARLYKAFLNCAARLIRANDGKIVSYDGDRVMAVYMGENKEEKAVRTALKIKYAVTELVNKKSRIKIKYVVGIDRSNLFASRIGIHKDNDLVWIGRAANYAAKLCSQNGGHCTYITENVYNSMAIVLRPTGIWTAYDWIPYVGSRKIRIYGADAHIQIS